MRTRSVTGHTSNGDLQLSSRKPRFTSPTEVDANGYAPAPRSTGQAEHRLRGQLPLHDRELAKGQSKPHRVSYGPQVVQHLELAQLVELLRLKWVHNLVDRLYET